MCALRRFSPAKILGIQYWGSGYAGGFVCFWASWIWIRIYLYEIPYGSGSFCNQAKIVRKTLIPTVSWLLYDFLSLKNNVNVVSKGNKPKIHFLVVMLKIIDENTESGSVSQRYGSRGSGPKSHGSATLIKMCHRLWILSAHTEGLKLIFFYIVNMNRDKEGWKCGKGKGSDLCPCWRDRGWWLLVRVDILCSVRWR